MINNSFLNLKDLSICSSVWSPMKKFIKESYKQSFGSPSGLKIILAVTRFTDSRSSFLASANLPFATIRNADLIICGYLGVP